MSDVLRRPLSTYRLQLSPRFRFADARDLLPYLDDLGITDCYSSPILGFGHLVDFVPNHMSCDPTANPWWRDVLENGPSSPYAGYFDIAWDPIKPELKGKVLLPLLGDQYGRVLERGELQLRFDAGALHLRYFDRDLPINPRQSPRVLGLDIERLDQRL